MDIPTPALKTRVQSNGQDTSWDAALLQTPERTARLYQLIYDALSKYGPWTDEELEEYLRHSQRAQTFTPSGIRSRRNELVQTGWVRKHRDEDGQVVKRRGDTGSPRIVWEAIPEGEDVDLPVPTQAPAQEGHTFAQRLAAARRLALWEIGDSTWADRLVAAYLDPDAANAELDAEGAPELDTEVLG